MANQNEQESGLNAHDIEQMRGAILSAYPDLDFLYLRIADKWGVNVQDYFGTSMRGRIPIVKDLADWAHSEGKLLELVGLAWTEKKGNPNLRDIVRHYFADPDELDHRYALAPIDHDVVPPEREPLEKIVNERSHFSSMDEFMARLSVVSRAICRVQYLNIAGTGFLIGRRSVLTNFHVLKTAIEQGLPGSAIRCEFDFHLDGGSQTVVCLGAAGTAWKGPASPYSPSDLTGRGEPEAGSFDYAVLRLENPVEAGRPAIPLPSTIPIIAPQDTVAIVQHPGGDAQAIAWGRVLEYPASGLRYRYDVATASGSSGSPVLSADLSLVALHHAADPANAPKYNQGVPIWRVIEAMKPELQLGDL